MIEPKILQRALIIGTVLQIAMILIGHFSPFVRDHVFMFGGMMISATAGYIYAMDLGAGYGRGAVGGAIAGGACALIGIAASVLLGDTQPFVIVLGTSISILTGAVGGLWGEVAAKMRKRGW